MCTGQFPRPPSLAQLYRFCEYLNHKLSDPKLEKKHIYYYSSVASDKRANAVFLLSAWSLLYQGKTPEEVSVQVRRGRVETAGRTAPPPPRARVQAWEPFAGIYPPLPPWHDASPTVCTYNLTVLDTLKGIARAVQAGFFDFDTFPIEEYEHWEQPSNGDLSWIQYGKILAFAGPHNHRSSHDGYYTLTPEDYIPQFKKWGVKLVIRLNKKYYDEERFIKAGMDHLDLYYLDGSNPPEHILATVMDAMERCDGAIAIHCKAGLGRTGTCIACHMMKHYGFTAAEAIAWLRVCRPGSVIGPQQHFLEDMMPRMVKEGQAMRAAAADARKALAVEVGSAPDGGTPSGHSADSAAAGGGASPLPTPTSVAAEHVPSSAGVGRYAASPGGASVASDASQGDHLRASRQRASPTGGARGTSTVGRSTGTVRSSLTRELSAGARGGSGGGGGGGQHK